MNHTPCPHRSPIDIDGNVYSRTGWCHFPAGHDGPHRLSFPPMTDRCATATPATVSTEELNAAVDATNAKVRRYNALRRPGTYDIPEVSPWFDVPANTEWRFKKP